MLGFLNTTGSITHGVVGVIVRALHCNDGKVDFWGWGLYTFPVFGTKERNIIY